MEVHIGCVAANIPLMGPLFSRVIRRLGKSSHTQITWDREGSENLKGHVPSARGSNGIGHRFKRMEDYEPGPSVNECTLPPVVGRDEKAALEPIELNNLGSHGIMVKTDLEQSYRNR